MLDLARCPFCHRSVRAILGFALLTAITSPALSAEGYRRAFTVENDAWASSDRNYTMGASFVEVMPRRLKGGLTGHMIDWLGALNHWLKIDDLGPDRASNSAWAIASSAFTPDNITDPDPIQDDRPFANVIYLGVRYTIDGETASIESWLDLGILGTQFGETVQTEIHRACCRDRMPRGWTNQVGQGGAPTFRYGARRTWHVLQLKPLVDLGFYKIDVYAGGELGYYTRAMTGGTLYFGGSQRALQALTDAGVQSGRPVPLKQGLAQVATDSPAPDANAQKIPRPAAADGFSAWLDVELSAFGHNSFLQGAWYGRNRVTFDYNEIEPVVLKVAAGVELTFLASLVGIEPPYTTRLYLIKGIKSRDLKSPAGESHSWAGLVLSWAFDG